MPKKFDQIRHDYIRYSNCWEDADVLLKGLNIQKEDRVLSIASAGDNSFSMLINNPQIVVAVDINRAQLYLVELKKEAFANLDYDTFLQFLGFKDCQSRWKIYQTLQVQLSDNAVEFWNNKKIEINNGLIYSGKFEKYFLFFSKNILPLIHSKKRIYELLKEKSNTSQNTFFIKKWNNLRWNILFQLFFSKFILGRFGRDPQFLNEVTIPVSKFILSQAKKHLSNQNCQQNYFLQFILTGKFSTQLPHYARKENFEKIKENINRLEIHQGVAETAFQKFSTFNKFNLSNIFEYMNADQFQKTSNLLIANGAPKARYSYWNLMVPRQMSKINNEVKYDLQSPKISKNDYGFFYNNFIIDTKS